LSDCNCSDIASDVSFMDKEASSQVGQSQTIRWQAFTTTIFIPTTSADNIDQIQVTMLTLLTTHPGSSRYSHLSKVMSKLEHTEEVIETRPHYEISSYPTGCW